MEASQKILGGVLITLILLWSYLPVTDQVQRIAANTTLPANATSRTIGNLLVVIYPDFHLIMLVASLALTIAIIIDEMSK